MKKLIIGTTNPAKVEQIAGVLRELAIKVIGIENKESLPVIEEDGKTALENARKKASAYAKALGETVMSIDNALYFEGLEETRQPGVEVRRINGREDRPSDEELLEYYTKLVDEQGGRVRGYWEYGICIAGLDGVLGEVVVVSPRVFTSTRSKKMVPGYPLESIQIVPESGEYVSEMTIDEQEKFWKERIGTEIIKLVETVLG